MDRRSTVVPPPPPPLWAWTDPHSGHAPSMCVVPGDGGPLVRDTTPPPPPADTAVRAAAAFVSGLPQSEQNCALAAFCRPQYSQVPRERLIKKGGPSDRPAVHSDTW